MHPDQVHIDLPAARRLIREQFPQWAGRRVVHVATDGTMNEIFRIGDDLGARFPLRGSPVAEVAASLRAEAEAMTEFAAASPVASPSPIALGEPGHGYPLPWSIQTWIPGVVATPTCVAESVPFAHDLAELIRSLRATDVRGREFSGEGRGGNLHDSDEWMALCLRESTGIVDVDRVSDLWHRLAELPRDSPDVMCHGDLTAANLLVADGRLVGVLDTGGFAAADPGLDLVVAWHLLDREARDALRADLGSNDLEWARGQAWALQQAMGLVWYYATSNPNMAAQGRITVARILADDSVVHPVTAT
jgi:aminoglycoside phosphotransferase (APT) family kinase protein